MKGLSYDAELVADDTGIEVEDAVLYGACGCPSESSDMAETVVSCGTADVIVVRKGKRIARVGKDIGDCGVCILTIREYC